ncbi:MAG: NAD+ synthase, partial [Polaromonas sp.]|nr:NAD+ synthase [Polaromonas sp.]
MLNITIAQLNFTVGDLTGNAARMIQAARQADADQADIVVFSELALTAYYPGDLLDDSGFITRVESTFDALLNASRQWPTLHWVIGLPVRRTGPGKPLANALRVIRDGQVLLDYAKQLLPTYNIFDERRHFEPGPDVAKVLNIRGVQTGFLICEDGWNDHGQDYPLNPFERLRDAAPDLVISIN